MSGIWYDSWNSVVAAVTFSVQDGATATTVNTKKMKMPVAHSW